MHKRKNRNILHKSFSILRTAVDPPQFSPIHSIPENQKKNSKRVGSPHCSLSSPLHTSYTRTPPLPPGIPKSPFCPWYPLHGSGNCRPYRGAESSFPPLPLPDGNAVRPPCGARVTVRRPTAHPTPPRTRWQLGPTPGHVSMPLPEGTALPPFKTSPRRLLPFEPAPLAPWVYLRL